MNNPIASTQLSNSGNDATGVSLPRIAGAAAVALVLNLMIFALATAAGAALKVNAPEPVNVISVSVATAVPLLLAGVATWYLARRFQIRRLMGWAGLLFAILSSAGSFMAAADTATALTLTAMHFVAGFAWFIALQPWRSTPQTSILK